MLASLLPLCIAVSLSSATQGPTKAPPSDAPVVAIPDHGLAFVFETLTDITEATEKPSPGKHCWKARFEGHATVLEVTTPGIAENGLGEPEDAVEAERDACLDGDNPQKLAFEPLRPARAPAGSSPWLAVTHSGFRDGDARGETFIVGGLLDRCGWVLTVHVLAVLTPDLCQRLEADLCGSVRWKGAPRDPRWTDAEAKALFERHAPPDALKRYQKPIRTPHFLLLSSHSSAGQYAKKLEAWYAEIAKALPLDEAKDRRLLPVLLFRHDEEYKQFFADVENLESKLDVDHESWCGGSWYATHFDNDDDYDNRIELTKLLLINRVRGWNACLWFRSGLREYCATRANERGAAVRAVRKQKHTPLEKLLDDSAWGERLRRSELTGVDAEVDYWDQSGLWTEFLRESKTTKAKFADYVRAMSAIPREDVARVKETLAKSFDCDVVQLERRYVEYCVARK